MIVYKVEWILIDLNYNRKQMEELISFCENENTTPVYLAAEILGCIDEEHILKAPHLRPLFTNPVSEHKTFDGPKPIENRRAAENFFNNIVEVLLMDNGKKYYTTPEVEEAIKGIGLRKTLEYLAPSFGLCYVSMSYSFLSEDRVIDDHFRPGWTKLENWSMEYQYYQDGGFAMGGDKPYEIIVPELGAPILCLPDVERAFKRVV